MAYIPKKYTTGITPASSAFLNQEDYMDSVVPSLPVRPKATINGQKALGSFLEQASTSDNELSFLDQMRMEELATKPLVEKEQPKQSWLGSFAQSTGAKIGYDVVNTISSAQGLYEKLRSSALGQPDKTQGEILSEAYQNIVTGKDIKGGLTTLAKSADPALLIKELAKSNISFAGKVIEDVKQGKGIDIKGNAYEAISEGGLSGFVSRTARSDIQEALRPTEERLQQRSAQAEEVIGEVASAITGGIGSLPSSIMAQALPAGSGMFLLWMRSFENAKQEAWAIEKSTGQKIDDKDIYLYSIGQASLEIAIESASNKVGSGIGKITSKITGGKFGNRLASADGWVKNFFRTNILKVGTEATKEALENAGKTTLKKTLSDIAEATFGEGLEELVNGIGSGVLSKYTINPSESLNFLDKESQWYWKSLGLSFISGATGGLIGGGSTNIIANLLNKHGDKTLDEIANDDGAQNDIDETLSVGSRIEPVQERMEQTSVDILQNAQEQEATQATTIPAEAPTMAQDAVEAQTQESTTPIAEAVAEPSMAVEQYAGKDVGIHFGNLGKAEFLRNQTGTRDTGHFGTGTYFVSPSYAETMSKSRNYGERPAYSVNFSDYNLFKPQNSNKGLKFHDALRFLNNKITFNADRILNGEILEYNKIEDALYEWEETITDETPRGDNGKLSALDSYLIELYGQEEIEYAKETEPMWRKYEELVKNSERIINNLNGDIEYFNNFVVPELSLQTETSNSEILKIIKNVSKKYSKNGKIDFNTTEDTISTEVMKQLGYEGVDVRGLTGLDDEQYGSVIYDLKQPKSEQPTPTPSKPVEKVAEAPSKSQASTEQVEKPKRDYAKEVYEKQQRGESVDADVKEYLSTDEGKAFSEDIKTSEDVAVKVGEILSDLSTSSSYPNMLRNVNLQLLALKSLADKLSETPAGADVNRAVVRLIEAMKSTKPEEMRRVIEESFSGEQLFHDIFTNSKATRLAAERLERAKKKGVHQDAYSEALLDELYETGRIPTPDDNVVLMNYVKRLTESADADGGFAKVSNVVERIGKLGTKGGQYIQSFRMLKAIFPEMQATKIISNYKKATDIPQSDLDEAEKEAEKIVNAVKKDRKKAAKDATEEVEKKIKADLFPKDSIVPAALSFEKYLKHVAEITVKDKKEKTLNQKIVTQLVEKFKQAYNMKTEKVKDDPYAILAEIINNKSKYALIWDTVKDYLKNDKNYQWRTYFNEETAERSDPADFRMEKGDFYSFVNDIFVSSDPAAAPTALRRVVRANLDSTNVSLAEMAYNYFMQGNESLTGFFESLRSKFPEMDDASYNYLRESIRKEFIDMLDIKRMQSVSSVIEATKRNANKKKIKTQQEVITDMLSKATYYEAFDIPEIRDLWARKAGLPVLTQEDVQLIYKAMHDTAKAKTDDEKNKIYQDMVDALAKGIKATNVEKVQAWLRTAMLLNPSTILGNPLANMLAYPYYRAMDIVNNKFLRIVKAPESDLFAGVKIEKYNPNTEIGKVVESKTTKEHLAYALAMSAKYNLHTEVKQNSTIFETKWIEELNKIPFDAMSTGKIGKHTYKMLGDYGMFEIHYRNAMYNKMIAMGYSESLSKAEKDNIIKTASEYGANIAIMRTFRAMNIVSNMLKNLQQSALFKEKIRQLEEEKTPTSLIMAENLRRAGKAAQMAVKVVTPFIVTPAALVAESYKFSPIALVKALAIDNGLARITGRWNNPGHRSVYSQKVSQALVGTLGQFAVGFALSAFGLMSAGSPEDEKEKELWKVEGKKPYSIKLFGNWVPIDWAQPISTVIMMGAQTFQNINNADSFGELAYSPISGTFGTLINESIYSNLNRIFGTSYGQDDGLSGAKNIAMSGIFQAFPSVLLRLNRTLDPVLRDPYTKDALLTMGYRALMYVPFGSMLVPPKVDVWGNEIRYSKAKGVVGAFQRFFLNTVAPFTVSEDRQDSVTREVTRVYNATSNSEALPSMVGNTIDGLVLSDADYEWYQKRAGELCYNAVKKFVESNSYKDMTDEKRAAMFAKIYKQAKERARNEYSKTHKTP